MKGVNKEKILNVLYREIEKELEYSLNNNNNRTYANELIETYRDFNSSYVKGLEQLENELELKNKELELRTKEVEKLKLCITKAAAEPIIRSFSSYSF